MEEAMKLLAKLVGVRIADFCNCHNNSASRVRGCCENHQGPGQSGPPSVHNGCTATPNAFFSACDTPAIPAGQEVVIETISFNGNGDPGNIVLVPAVTTTAAGVQRLYFLNQLPDTTLGQPARAEYEGAQSLRLYAGPGTIIVCNGFTDNLNPTMGVSVGCTISGYFVALP